MVDDLTKGPEGGCPEPAGDAGQMAEAKSDLRRTLLQRRGALPEGLALQVGETAQRRLLEDPAWKRAGRVALYVSCRGEAGTRLLLERAWAEEKIVLLPKVLPRSQAGPGQMVFARCAGRHQLAPGAFRIPEPDLRICPIEETPPDLIVLPAVGLDRRGFRLGYGGGYYDRFLSRGAWQGLPRVGLVFALQIVEALPCEPWDIRVHALLSEEALVWL